MAKIFDIEESDFFDSDLVKIIEGVAGFGKSSIVVDAMRTHFVDFIWTTSTNKLKRDAIERFGVKASTTCSALFTNDGGRFYIDFKTPKEKTIVIDEILQSSPRVLDWIREHRGEYNIIILTDEKQMLAKGIGRGRRFLQEFEELKSEDFVIVYEGKETKRARDAETKDMIEYLYNKASHDSDEFPKAIASKRFPVVFWNSVSYNKNDIFIFHKNELEDDFYREQKISDGIHNLSDLIPKGSIASKEVTEQKNIPIMSQLQAEKTRASQYFQMINCGSPTRYQGSECRDDQKLYFFFDDLSRVTNREWYTVLSRCWNMNSIVFVVKQKKEKTKLTTFKGRKVLEYGRLSIMEGESK